MTMLAVAVGSVVWGVIGSAAVVLLAVTTLARPGTLPNAADVVRWFLRSWVGRGLMIALWAEAGWHLFTQRP